MMLQWTTTWKIDIQNNQHPEAPLIPLPTRLARTLRPRLQHQDRTCLQQPLAKTLQVQIQTTQTPDHKSAVAVIRNCVTM